MSELHCTKCGQRKGLADLTEHLVSALEKELEAERKKVEKLREALSSIRADMRKMCEGHAGRKVIRGYFELCDKVIKETESGE